MEEIKDKEPIAVIVPVERKEFWLITKIKTHAKEKPKKTFIIMLAMVATSVLISVGQLIYVLTVEVPKYEKMKKQNIFDGAGNSLAPPVKETQNLLELQQVIKELDHYKTKKDLTKQDSIRIIYLIDKYKEYKVNSKK